MVYPLFVKIGVWCGVLGLCFTSVSASLVSLDPSLLVQAQEHNKPLAVLLLNPGSCPWSERLKEQLISGEQLKKNLGSEVVFSAVEYRGSKEDLLEGYGLTQLPALVLLDPKGRVFAHLSCDVLDPAALGRKALGLVEDFHQVCQAIDRGLVAYSEPQLRRLYIQSCRFVSPYFKQLLLAEGLNRETGVFFHLEQYAALLKKMKLKAPQVTKCKESLLRKDPDNALGAHSRVARLEFEYKRDHLKRKEGATKVIVPLENYLERFGSKDEDRWRIEWLIVEFLLDQNAFELARTYFDRVKAHAPVAMRPQVKEAWRTLSEIYGLPRTDADELFGDLE